METILCRLLTLENLIVKMNCGLSLSDNSCHSLLLLGITTIPNQEEENPYYIKLIESDGRLVTKQLLQLMKTCGSIVFK